MGVAVLASLALVGPVGGVPARSQPVLAAANYSNPVVWQDFADLDVIRVNDTYYYSASTMHYSPGAPILRSYDLVNWEPALGGAVTLQRFELSTP